MGLVYTILHALKYMMFYVNVYSIWSACLQERTQGSLHHIAMSISHEEARSLILKSECK